MTSAQRVGRIIGMLLLVHLATGLIVPYVLLLPLTTPPAGFLETAAGFWTDWGSFIFMKSEGIYDLNGDGTFNQSDQGFEHHPGKDDVLTSVTKLKSFTLEKGTTFDLDLVADLYKIYVENGTALDLSDPANKDTQEAADLPLAIELMSHWEQACEF